MALRFPPCVPPDPLRPRAALALGLLHAVALGLAFPPIGLWPAALLALWPLTRLALRAPEGRLGPFALLASLGTLPFWAWSHQFVIGSSALGFYPLVMYLSIYPGLYVWLLGRIVRRLPRLPLWLGVPLVWVGLEFLRGEVMLTGYAWYLVGQPLIDMGPALRYIPFVGMYGVSAWVAVVTGWCFDFSRWWRDTAPNARFVWGGRAVAVAIGVGLAAGISLIPERLENQGERVRVAVLQTNLKQEIKGAWTFDQRLDDMERFAELSVFAAERRGDEGEKVELIIWPETMFPGFWLNEEAVTQETAAGLSIDGTPTTIFRERLLQLSEFLNTPLLVGAIAAEGVAIGPGEDGRLRIDAEREFNSAFVVQSGRVSPHRYDKLHLTPFGETMPVIGAWPWLQERLLAIGARGMTFGLSRGERDAPLRVTLPSGREVGVATPICFEASLQGVCRRIAYKDGVRRADLIAAITNDGWFHWHDAGRDAHLLMSRWRCAELGISMVRAANTGVSAVIDPQGRILTEGVDPPGGDNAPRGRTRVEGVLVAEAPLPTGAGTIFGRHGDIAGRSCMAGMLLLAAIALVPRRKPKMNPPAGENSPAPEPTKGKPPTMPIEPRTGRSAAIAGAAMLSIALTACAQTQPHAGTAGGPSQSAGVTQVARSTLRERALEILAEGAVSPDPQIRANSIEGLQAAPTRAEAAARAGLTDVNPGVRFVAAMTIGTLQLVDSGPYVEPLLNDSNPHVRAAAMYALARLGKTVDLTPLAGMLEDPDPRVRAEAARVLGELGNPSAAPMLRSAAARSGQTSSAPGLRLELYQAERIFQLQVAEALVKLGDSGASDAVRAALHPAAKEGFEAAALAAQILGDIRDVKAAGQLVDLIEQTAPGTPVHEDPRKNTFVQPPELRMAAARALALMGHPGGMYVAEMYSTHANERIRAQAAFVFAASPREADLRRLETMMRDSSPVVRISAAAATLRLLERLQ